MDSIACFSLKQFSFHISLHRIDQRFTIHHLLQVSTWNFWLLCRKHIRIYLSYPWIYSMEDIHTVWWWIFHWKHWIKVTADLLWMETKLYSITVAGSNFILNRQQPYHKTNKDKKKNSKHFRLKWITNKIERPKYTYS